MRKRACTGKEGGVISKDIKDSLYIQKFKIKDLHTYVLVFVSPIQASRNEVF